ncbi:hypothetical protein AX17_005084 [Amanita inopinata Kibby_2008]|nr:hypothetical protein AX17_005084 [Amanita inopinata Kibby_2008]
MAALPAELPIHLNTFPTIKVAYPIILQFEQRAHDDIRVIHQFGYSQIPVDLNCNNIHRLENVLTLDVGVRSMFDNLKLWFEPTDTPNTYKLRAPKSGYILSNYKSTVTFSSPDLKKLPLPSPEYLKIHAVCARVAHLSGAGEYIDKISREIEYTKVLSKDGASAEALEHALLPLSQQVGLCKPS